MMMPGLKQRRWHWCPDSYDSIAVYTVSVYERV